MGLPSPTPRENLQQRSQPHPTQVPAVGHLPAPRPPSPPHSPHMRLKKENVRATEPPSQSSREDVSFRIRACRQKHFTVHVEQRFFCFTLSIFLFFYFHPPSPLLLFSSANVSGPDSLCGIQVCRKQLSIDGRKLQRIMGRVHKADAAFVLFFYCWLSLHVE